MDVFQKATNALLVLGLAAFLIVGFLGFFHSAMPMEEGVMPPCPFMAGQVALCTMNPLEHIAAWQSAFIFSIQDFLNALLLLLIAILAAQLLRSLWRIMRPPLVLNTCIPRETSAPPIHFLQELFSDGILNSRAF